MWDLGEQGNLIHNENYTFTLNKVFEGEANNRRLINMKYTRMTRKFLYS